MSDFEKELMEKVKECIIDHLGDGDYISEALYESTMVEDALGDKGVKEAVTKKVISFIDEDYDIDEYEIRDSLNESLKEAVAEAVKKNAKMIKQKVEFELQHIDMKDVVAKAMSAKLSL